MGVLMSIFSCSACGGHAFKLSADLKQAHCEDCKTYLGSWQTLRAKLKQNLRPTRPTLRVYTESTEMILG
jgi:RNase P subunit RPR2